MASVFVVVVCCVGLTTYYASYRRKQIRNQSAPIRVEGQPLQYSRIEGEDVVQVVVSAQTLYDAFTVSSVAECDHVLRELKDRKLESARLYVLDKRKRFASAQGDSIPVGSTIDL